MSDKDMPSRQALDLAVKPAGFRDWKHYTDDGYTTQSILGVTILAYAADLDKADKVGRMILEVTPEKLPAGPARDCRELARELILPEASDPLLAAWKADHQDAAVTREYMQGLEAAFDWITKRELARGTDAMGHGGPVSAF